MLSPWRKHHLCCWLRCLCFHLCLLQRRMKCLFCLLHGGQETRRACWSKQNADACGVGKRDVDRRGANRWRDGGGITSSLPTRQPWVLLLCWIECNRPGFFSLTTGACEHTSSPPWERRLSWQSQCLCLCYFRLLSLPAPHLRLCLTRSSFLVLFVLAICFFFFCLFFPPSALSLSVSLYITQGDIIFILFQNGMKSIWVMCSQGLLSKALNVRHLSGKILIENPGLRR